MAGKQLELEEGAGIVLTPQASPRKVTIGAVQATTDAPGVVQLAGTLGGGETDKAPSVAAVDTAIAGLGALPSGGTAGQVLTKDSSADGDADWKTISDATTTAKGIVLIATDAEVATGTNTQKTVTPKQLAGKQNKSERGAANGYAPLDANSKVPAANLPASPVVGSLEGDEEDKAPSVAAVNAALEDCTVDTSTLVPKSGATMTGALVAQDNTNYDTAQARNIIISATDLTAGSSSLESGRVWMVYE